MSNASYSLEVISQHPTFRNKSLRKYYVDGIETIGAWGDEPFEIKFTNHTWQKVQVKITLDGTDVLTGEPATTDPGKDMWVVNGYGTMTLKAWPETNNGGAGFVFTSANNSVAVHTHGDLSSRGIIAAAVYTEGHVEPIKVNPWPIVIDHHHHHYGRRRSDPYYYTHTIGGDMLGGTIYTQGIINNNSGNLGSQAAAQNASFNATAGDNYFSLCSDDGGAAAPGPASAGVTRSLESLASVGAGQYTDQKITYVTGLIKPVLSETVRVRYMWWDELVAKLRENHVPAPHASGFPADKKKLNINLGSTPRIGSYQQPAFPREQAQSQPTYLRV